MFVVWLCCACVDKELTCLIRWVDLWPLAHSPLSAPFELYRVAITILYIRLLKLAWGTCLEVTAVLLLNHTHVQRFRVASFVHCACCMPYTERSIIGRMLRAGFVIFVCFGYNGVLRKTKLNPTTYQKNYILQTTIQQGKRRRLWRLVTKDVHLRRRARNISSQAHMATATGTSLRYVSTVASMPGLGVWPGQFWRNDTSLFVYLAHKIKAQFVLQISQKSKKQVSKNTLHAHINL